MTEEKRENEQAEPYTLMDVRDEGQILKEMRGEFIETYVYSFKQGGRDITNLSYIGIKEAIRRRGGIEIIGDPIVTEVDGKIRALVKVHDCVNRIDVLGASEADAEKPFAFVLAVNKAERNAFSKLIPAKFFAQLIEEKLHGSKPTPVQPRHVVAEVKEGEVAVPLRYRLMAEIPEVLAPNLNVDETKDLLIAKPKQMFEKEEFKKLCQIVESFGGKWVPVSGEWQIPLKQ